MYATLGSARGRQFWTSRGASLVAIVVLHIGMIGLVLLHRAAQPEAVPEIISVSLLSVPQHAPLQQPKVATRPQLDPLTQPAVLPPEFALPEPEKPAQTITLAVAAPVPPAPATSDASSNASAPLVVTKAEFLRPPVIRYPPAALAARQEGSVGLRVLVAEDGSIQEIAVEQSSGVGVLDEAARDAMRLARFKPYMVNGTARRVLIRIPFDYFLKRNRTS
jgi:periplasmic protein TonB